MFTTALLHARHSRILALAIAIALGLLTACQNNGAGSGAPGY
jgi:hypothetical protein